MQGAQRIPQPAKPADPMLGRTIAGRYRLEARIGEGGMGVVYRASHAMLRRPAAIKLLLPERAGEKDLARFEREVQLTSRLAHPNTISIFDYGRTAGGVFYYVMEYLDGFDLERIVDEDGPSNPRAPFAFSRR
jgi:serine/threonine protein kinase